MNPLDQGLAHTQSQESAQDNIVPLPTRSQLLRSNTVGTGDVGWLQFNLLSLGIPAKSSRIKPS